MRNSAKFAALVLAVALAGCTTAPIMNVSEAAVTTASGKPLTNEQVRAAILRAAAALGWQLKDEGPNLLVGTLRLRDHTAVIQIPYSPKTYSVQYRSSVNLDEQAGSIHKNYNGWIQNLQRGIHAQLSAS